MARTMLIAPGSIGHTAVTAARNTPRTIAPVIACIHVIGRAAACVDSRRARTAARHQICPAAGTITSMRA